MQQKSVHVARFTGPGQTCFAATQASRQTQQPDLMQGRFDLGGKMCNIAFQLVLHLNVAKEVASFCRLFFRTSSEQLF